MSDGEFKPVLLSRVGKQDSASLASYQADGGYSALRKALSMTQAQLIDLVKASGLRVVVGLAFRPG